MNFASRIHVYACLRVRISASWCVCPSVCVSFGMVILRREPPPPPPRTGASNAGGVGKNRDSEPRYGLLLPAVNAATGQVLSTRSSEDHGHRTASCDTSLVVSGGVHCGRRLRNVYDKKPRRYAKDNRTEHLTARSDKSVAYVTNNKRLYSTCCTVEERLRDTKHRAASLRQQSYLYLNMCTA